MLSALLEHGFDIQRLAVPRSVAPLHCMTIAAGYEQRRDEVYSWDGMERGTAPFLVIQHTTYGEGRLDFAGVQHRLTPGRTMLVTMPHAHRYYLERGGHWEYFWLLINGREALRLALEILDAAGPVLTLAEGEIDRLADAALKAMTMAAPSPGRVSTLAYEAMTALHDSVFGLRQLPSVQLPPPIDRVIGYIDDNLGRPLQVEHLATVAGMSRAHFVRVFTGAMSMAPSDFVMAQRLDRAERLLMATELSVGEIATLAGFANGNYLSKVFRRKRSVTPLAFRTQLRSVLEQTPHNSRSSGAT